MQNSYVANYSSNKNHSNSCDTVEDKDHYSHMDQKDIVYSVYLQCHSTYCHSCYGHSDYYYQRQNAQIWLNPYYTCYCCSHIGVSIYTNYDDDGDGYTHIHYYYYCHYSS